MPSLTLHPPRQQSPAGSNLPSRLPPLAPAGTANFGQANSAAPAPGSPVAPEYSPITPRAQPALPATYTAVPPGEDGDEQSKAAETVTETSTAEFISQPAPQPFSGEDATDAIALRAAISSLQFQRQKAQDDIRKLEKIKQQALESPNLFREELIAGRLQEQKPSIGDLRAILDHEGSDDDDEEVDLRPRPAQGAATNDAKGPDSQHPELMTSTTAQDQNGTNGRAPFDRIPGPQNVVRMPYVNWDKYHITGEPIDSMHEQQRRWPGSTAYGQDRGREFAVAAPYSPWADSLDGQGQQRWDRNDSFAVTPTSTMTPSGSISEHPMETRRRNRE